jgi:voltage-gated potassium channel
MLADRIVYLCYFLEESQRYKTSKDFFYDLLENPQSALRSYFDLTMAVLILLSVFVLIYEVKHPLPGYGIWFENLLVIVLISEYLLRLWLYSDSRKTVIAEYEKTRFLNTRFSVARALRMVLLEKWRYVISPMAIIDLLAILPSYRPLRVLRFFLLFRVFKLFRYTRNVNEFSRVLLEKRFELYTLLILVSFVTFASATAIYIFEATDDKSQINTFFDAIYWALITLSTVGYGDITRGSAARPEPRPQRAGSRARRSPSPPRPVPARPLRG